MKQKFGSVLGTLSILPHFPTCLAHSFQYSNADRALPARPPAQTCVPCMHTEWPEVTYSLVTVLSSTVLIVYGAIPTTDKAVTVR